MDAYSANASDVNYLLSLRLGLYVQLPLVGRGFRGLSALKVILHRIVASFSILLIGAEY